MSTTADVCEVIANMRALTTVDTANILRALGLRHAETPLQQQGRADVDKVLHACHAELIDIWTRDQQ